MKRSHTISKALESIATNLFCFVLRCYCVPSSRIRTKLDFLQSITKYYIYVGAAKFSLKHPTMIMMTKTKFRDLKENLVRE